MKILVVDKDPALTAELAARLHQAGHSTVGQANSADEAKKSVFTTGGVDLLITDVIMEGGDGFALRETLLSIFPSLQTIFLSEYDLSDYQDRMVGCPLLQKPFAPEALLELVSFLHQASPASPATPQAAPAAQPNAAPTPVAQPAAPTPVPTPQATPVAQPTPVPVKATAQPATSTPVATPKATPVAQPTPVPVKATAQPATPTPVAAPKATPVAQPAPVPVKATAQPATPTPVAAPKATPVAQPAPVPVKATAQPATPTPVAAPKAAPVAQPTPAPVKATAPKAAAPAAKASPAKAVAPAAAVRAGAAPAPAAPAMVDTELPPDELVGTTLGDYFLEAKIGTTAVSSIYRAVQQKMNRKVRLYVFDRQRHPDPAAAEAFMADAGYKARVQHSYILSVYEAGESEGKLFYSSEYLAASTLEQNLAKGQLLNGRLAYMALKTTTEALVDLARQEIRHLPLSARSILITGPQQIRLTNTAALEPEGELTPAQEIQQLGTILLPALDANAEAQAPGLTALLQSMAAGSPDLASWETLQPAIQAIAPKTKIADAHKLEAKELATKKALEAAKKQQRRSVVLTGITSLSLLAVGFVILYWALFLRGSSYKDFNTMIEIPANEFTFQDGETISLPTFWIAEHPVTIGQYAEFLRWVRANPERLSEIAHPDAPRNKDYIPDQWADQDAIDMPGYYTRARRWGKFGGFPLNLDSPVFGVDFYDAYGYAKWRGMRLPTEQEWEKAARGRDGRLYPWGNEPNHSWVNSGQDFNPNPAKGGEVDGWKRWNPVTSMRRDRSPFGVMGMAGNVSEWTDSWEESPQFHIKVPVIRGGNWQNPDYRVTRRLLLRLPEQNDMVLGFRIASSVPPADVKPIE
jgi:formylglycine-generating enzyme required for sulfatase activity/DNA-binding NarL/FixJ family response regulator